MLLRSLTQHLKTHNWFAVMVTENVVRNNLGVRLVEKNLSSEILKMIKNEINK